VDGCDLVAEADDAAGDDVRPEAAAVDEWAEESGSGESFEVGAWFGVPAADAFDGGDPRASADETVEGDSAGDDVAARLLPGELDLVEHLGLDECELVPTAGSAEGSAAVGVAPTRPRPASAPASSTRERGVSGSGAIRIAAVVPAAAAVPYGWSVGRWRSMGVSIQPASMRRPSW
jgi:hypothetical protein